MIVAKGEIAHNDPLLILPLGFQLYSVRLLDKLFSKSYGADLLYVGKGLEKNWLGGIFFLYRVENFLGRKREIVKPFFQYF